MAVIVVCVSRAVRGFSLVQADVILAAGLVSFFVHVDVLVLVLARRVPLVQADVVTAAGLVSFVHVDTVSADDKPVSFDRADVVTAVLPLAFVHVDANLANGVTDAPRSTINSRTVFRMSSPSPVLFDLLVCVASSARLSLSLVEFTELKPRCPSCTALRSPCTFVDAASLPLISILALSNSQPF
jgi:hypothetical protein